MAKGFLSGVVAGTVVSVLGLGVVSLQLAPVQPTQVAPPVVDQDVAAPDDTAPQTADVPVANDTPPDAISAPDTPGEMETTDVAPDADVPSADAPTPPPDPVVPESDASVETDAPAATPPADTSQPAEQDSTEEASGEPSNDAATEGQTKTDANLPQSIPDLANTPQIKSDPVAPIGDLADGVTTNRLPTIEQPVTEGGAAQSGADPVLTDTPMLAIDQNAAAFTNPEGRPLMSVVLFDQGAARQSLGDLNNLPFPVSFVVDTNDPNAAQAIAFYRDAGAEVLIVPAMPTNATPTDAEVIFQAQAPLLDLAVGVFLTEESGFQSNSQLAAQISEILAASGHGLVSEPQGLNTGHKTALKNGVAAGVVFRELDGEGQDGKVMRRFLDNAAFKAGQENGVIMLGRAQAETLQALIEWNLGNRAKSVAMAPVSALLLGGL
ncbi:divergent polysaccharide deacetylase family protein [Aliiroseovarius sp. F47248L]|uniref:divergent polysaccharide deacetylase family protein n=1 Tax=Aliiroseovarius sp. F47248L TaxID=2926420 RepID=UPI001FF40DF9|nr:divergent polysaccharide deacetylase family protein [Aliiroseovarius sp. F47248L]MCK0139150.1 divergent polysaccharide deacetylase family protein [Aliiroseovarius sp. F47248L]